MKILYLSHHWTNNSHHSKYSGFQRLVAEAAKSNEVTLVTWGAEDSKYQDELGITVITVKAAGKDFLFKKRLDISKMGSQIAANFDVVHSLYSDCTFHLQPNSYVVTFHVLPGVVDYTAWRQRVFINLKYWILQKRAMRRSRQIACVSNNLVAGIPQKFKSKTRFIPHGVDTEFWNPEMCNETTSPESRPYLLCVGSHGLDRTELEEFIGQNPSMQFLLVGLGAYQGNHSNVQSLSNLSDEKLRSLYFHAEAVIRPLKFATANNSILEAMSMGKTIVTSRISGVTDYLNDSTCVFIDTLGKKDLSQIAALKLDPRKIRSYAIENFSWKVILGQYFRCYNGKTQDA